MSGMLGQLTTWGPTMNQREETAILLSTSIILAGGFMQKKRATAKEAVEFMIEDVITEITKPKVLVSDNDTHFVGKLLAKLAEFSKICRKTTTPYHPQANTAAEQVMGVIRVELAKLSPD